MSVDTEHHRSRRYRIGVAILTVVWLVAVPVAAWFWLTNLGTSEDFPGLVSTPLSDWILLCVLALLAGGPVGIGVVAIAGRLRWTAVIYLVLGAVLAVPAALVAQDPLRRLDPPEPEPERTYQCMEHSGGDATCPGG